MEDLEWQIYLGLTRKIVMGFDNGLRGRESFIIRDCYEMGFQVRDMEIDGEL